MCGGMDEMSEFSSKLQRGAATYAFVAALMWVFFTVLSCSSTAVKGIPVGDLPGLKAEKRWRIGAASEEEKQEIARLSRVKQNKVFMEIEGIAEYRVGPLDVLEISSHVGDKVSTTTVKVNSRGRISYSFVDDLYVSGLTPSELDALLSRRLSSYIRYPRIDVLVNEFNSKTAMVMGEFASLRSLQRTEAASGRIYLKGRTTLLDLISQAGGYTVDGDVKRVVLTRRGKSYVINLFDIIARGDYSQNVIIDDEDTVNIPELPEFGERVFVLGEVAEQGVYRLKDAQDLLSALSLAGNYTRLAKEENTLIVRESERPGEEPMVMMANVKALLRGADLSQNIPLKDGDLVYVPPMQIGDVNRWISNITPLLRILLYPAEFDAAYFEDRIILSR